MFILNTETMTTTEILYQYSAIGVCLLISLWFNWVQYKQAKGKSSEAREIITEKEVIISGKDGEIKHLNERIFDIQKTANEEIRELSKEVIDNGVSWQQTVTSLAASMKGVSDGGV